jgi:hypothetical protein
LCLNFRDFIHLYSIIITVNFELGVN